MASSLPTAPPPPPPYQPTEEPDVPLLGKEEPLAAHGPQTPPPYAAAAAAEAPRVVVSQPQLVVLQAPLGVDSGNALCPACQQFVLTEVHFVSGTLTWLVCCGMCLMGLNLGCCLIPFCIDSCKDAVHECPRCGSLLHRHSRV